MTVSVRSVERNDRTFMSDATTDRETEYDVQAEIDNQPQAFRVVVTDLPNQPMLQLANFVDTQYKAVFSDHQVFMSKICRLVIGVHNGGNVCFPITLDES